MTVKASTAQAVVKRRTDGGHLAECPMCGSLDIGGATDTVNCYGCGLQITKPRPLQNAVDAWNTRGGKSLDFDLFSLSDAELNSTADTSDGFFKGKEKGNWDCDCHRCMEEQNAIQEGMILCDICGNKRCPRASDHRLECTHSNDTGQEGSIYE